MMTMNEIYKVVIIDDDYTATEDLKKRLTAYPDMSIRGTAVNGVKGKKIIMEQRPDLLFLDIELPDVLGIRLLSDMRDEIVWDMKVIFYTAYDKYLLQALRESAFDYLLKPFGTEELDGIIERYRKAMATHQVTSSFSASIAALLPQRDTFMISSVTGFKLLRIEEIGFFEYSKDKRQWQVTLFNQTKLSLKKNTKAEDIISYSVSFVQISQSVIINVGYLAVINGKQCQLYPPFNERKDLCISRGFLKELQERFCLI